ncbi:MAG: hypothetical protein ACHQHK_16100, partial [Dongiales bacterium]
MTSPRALLIQGFLAAAGWGAAQRRPITGDASFRRYERLTRQGESAVLMDAPPPRIRGSARPPARSPRDHRHQPRPPPPALETDHARGRPGGDIHRE